MRKEQQYVGHAAHPELMPNALIWQDGAFTEFAVLVCADSQQEAAERMKAWATLIHARMHLEHESGHINCNAHCFCPFELRVAKNILSRAIKAAVRPDLYPKGLHGLD